MHPLQAGETEAGDFAAIFSDVSDRKNILFAKIGIGISVFLKICDWSQNCNQCTLGWQLSVNSGTNAKKVGQVFEDKCYRVIITDL